MEDPGGQSHRKRGKGGGDRLLRILEGSLDDLAELTKASPENLAVAKFLNGEKAFCPACGGELFREETDKGFVVVCAKRCTCAEYVSRIT